MAIRAGAALAAALLAGCDLPRDPEGTYDRVRGGTLRVGIVAADEAQPEHASAAREDRAAVERFAQELGASPVWMHASAEALFLALERHELDLVIGGVYGDTPWRGRIALSKPAGPHPAERGAERRFAIPPGENKWLLAINRFLKGGAS